MQVSLYLWEVSTDDVCQNPYRWLTISRMDKIRSKFIRLELLPVVVVCLAVFNATGCIKPPKISLRDIEISSMNFQQLKVVCIFEVYNPNIFTANMKSFKCEVTASEKSIASGSSQPPIPSIPGGQRRDVSAAITIGLKDLAIAARNYHQGKAVPYNLAIRPVFDVLGMSLPVSFGHKGKIPAMQAPKWKLKSISLRRTLKPTVLVIFEISNSSNIRLSLEGIKGSLSLEGKPVLELEETKVIDLPDGKTVEVVIPVRIRLAALSGAAGKLITDWRSVKFNGEFKLKTPLAFKKMLLGKPTD